MSKTKFVSVDDTQKEKKETIFTHELDGCGGYIKTNGEVTAFEKVVYLGNCSVDGDMFCAYHSSGTISIYKGTKGDEFNQ